jgi:hypothetical protein
MTSRRLVTVWLRSAACYRAPNPRGRCGLRAPERCICQGRDGPATTRPEERQLNVFNKSVQLCVGPREGRRSKNNTLPG